MHVSKVRKNVIILRFRLNGQRSQKKNSEKATFHELANTPNYPSKFGKIG